MTSPTLYQKLTSDDNLYSAWLKVAGNMGAGGVDRVSIEDFESGLYDNLNIIKGLLEKGDYGFLPLLRFEIDKPSGGKRTLGIPTIRDRIVQQAMVNVLEPLFEPEFLDCSYAYRPRRSALHALQKIEKYLKKGRCWILDADIQSFFDTVNHAILLNLLASKINDDQMVSLIGNLLKSGAASKGMGIPQGAVTSPLFSNIYLHKFDKKMRNAEYRLVRFADDFVSLAASRTEADEALKLAENALNELQLKLNENKTRICSLTDGFVFLGYEFTERGKRPAPKAVQRFVTRLAQTTDGSSQERLESIIRGWLNYFKLDWKTYVELTSEFQTILDNKPDSLPARLALTALYLHSHKMDKAREVITSSSVVIPEDADINYQHGILCEELGMLGEATDDFLTAFRINPEDKDICYQLGLLYLKKNEIDKALRYLQRAIRIAPDFALAHYALGMAYKNWGLQGLARHSFEEAMTLEPKITSRMEVELTCEKNKEETLTMDIVSDIDLFLGLFGGREGVYARQWIDNKGKCGYFPVKEALSEREINAHIAGDLTIGLYLMRMDNTVKLMVIDIDVNKGALAKYLQDEEMKTITDQKIQEDTRRIKEVCDRMGCPVYFEDSGYKGIHCWFFFEEPIKSQEARELANAILKCVGEASPNTHREIFPKQDAVASDGFGSLVKLPLGIHKASGRRTFFVDFNGKPYSDQIQILREIKTISKDDVFRMKKSLQSGLSKAEEKPSEIVGRMIAGCNVIRFLVNKAKETGELSHTERLIILYTLGHLDDEGKQYVHQVMSYCLNYNQHYTQRWIVRLQPGIKPISCAKIRDWLSDITPAVGCYCKFKLAKGSYPSPVLYAKPEAATGCKRQVTLPTPAAILPQTNITINQTATDDNETYGIISGMVKEYICLKREAEGIHQQIQSVEDRLNARFNTEGVDSFHTELGLLRRIKGENRNLWVIEI